MVTYIAARSHIASCTSQRPDPRGFDHGPGLAIGSGQEVVQWPTVTLARKRQNCGYDQGTGSGVFQVGQRGARLNERQPAVPVLGGLLAYPFKAADPRVTFSRGDDACNPERAGRLQQPPPEPLTTCRQAPQECQRSSSLDRFICRFELEQIMRPLGSALLRELSPSPSHLYL